MQTFEEIAKRVYESSRNRLGRGYRDFSEVKKHVGYDIIKEVAIEYAKQACEEQRQLCHVSYSLAGVNRAIEILNAPLPELK